jgi:hypothetical protein
VLAACAAETPTGLGSPTAPPDRGPILVLGDSLAVGARDFGALAERLADEGWDPEILAEVGWPIGPVLEHVRARSKVPAGVVVVLGSNPGSSLGDFPVEVATLTDELVARGARRISWVPPHHADPERYVEKAGALRATAGDALRVLAWPEVLGANPQWFATDGLHLTEEGYEALASYIVESVTAG